MRLPRQFLLAALLLHVPIMALYAQAPEEVTELIPLKKVRASTAAQLLSAEHRSIPCGPHIEVDSKRNALIVHGTADQIEHVKILTRNLEREPEKKDAKANPGHPIFQYHAVPSGNAEAFVKHLQQSYKDDSLRISVSGPNRIFVWGPPKVQLEIAQQATKNGCGR